MTTQKHLKRAVRARMARTGERYAAARANLVATRGAEASGTSSDAAPGGIALAGIHPETNALRLLLARGGVVVVETGQPLSEAIVLGLGGGIGIGVFSFVYEKDDFSSFYLAGRHRWEDPLGFLRGAVERLGLAVDVRETGSARVAERDLKEMVEGGRPAIAWVDATELGTRGLPAYYAGGSYHVVTVLGMEAGSVVIADIAGAPFSVPTDVFARARARIRKDRSRLLSLATDAMPGTEPIPVTVAKGVRRGLKAGVESLADERRSNFRLDALRIWAERLDGSDRESWRRQFPRGTRLWSGLSSITRYVQHDRTGPGLLRPLFARCLDEASAMLEEPALGDVARRYDDLGRRWSALAEAALPADVALLGETRRIIAEQATLFREQPPGAAEALAMRWQRLDAIGREAGEAFPLDADGVDPLLRDLKMRVLDLHREEEAALRALAAALV
jgi:hypothetical protein